MLGQILWQLPESHCFHGWSKNTLPTEGPKVNPVATASTWT